MAENINIAGRLHSTATGNVVAGANEIYDDTKGKKQSVVNQETDAALDDRYPKSQTYNKTELNNLITTPNQEYVTVTATDQTTAATDVLPATGAADKVYRVGNWDGTQYDETCYSEYAWNGSAYVHLSTKTQIGEVFDISAYHATGGTLATYDNLNDALNGTNGGVPQSLQKGGMSVKYVQTYDNKYVQARCMAQNFTTDVTQWQVVDDEPIAGSENLIKSGGMFAELYSIIEGNIMTPYRTGTGYPQIVIHGINPNNNAVYAVYDISGKDLIYYKPYNVASLIVAGAGIVFFNDSELSDISTARWISCRDLNETGIYTTEGYHYVAIYKTYAPNSTNMGDIYDALVSQKYQECLNSNNFSISDNGNNISINIKNNEEIINTQILPLDQTPTLGSSKLVTSGGTASEILNSVRLGNVVSEEQNSEINNPFNIKVLFIGNSVCEDHAQYLPWLLKNTYNGKFDFTIGIAFKSSYTIKMYVENIINGSEEITRFSVAHNSAVWTINTNTTLLNAIKYTNWDIVVIEPFFLGSNLEDITYTEPFIDYIKSNTTNGVDIGVLAHQLYTIPYTSMKQGISTMLETYPIDIIFPCGLATKYMLDAGFEKSKLTPDNIHSTEGLPCIIGSYVINSVLADYYGFENRVIGNKNIISSAVQVTLNIPGQNGTLDDTLGIADYYLGQKSAIKAYKCGKGWLLSSCINIFNNF